MCISRLKKFNLREFNSPYPVIFVEAKDPDDACYKCFCLFTENILKQDESKETAKLIKDILPDVRVTKVYCKDEKKL
jgi:hypothetical protein